MVYVSGSEHFGRDQQAPELWVAAFDAATGTQQWSFRRESYPPRRPTVVDDTIYVGTRSHAIHAIDATDGTERWAVDLGASITGLAAVPQDGPDAVSGSIYAGCTDSHLYAVNAESGDVRWRERTRGIVNPPSVVDDVVYVTTMAQIIELNDDGSIRYEEDEIGRDKAVHAFDGGTGSKLWTVELDAERWNGSTPTYVGEDPVVADGTIYVAMNTSAETFKLYALSGAKARQSDAAPTQSQTESSGSGAGFTAIGTALGLLGAAGLERLRKTD